MTEVLLFLGWLAAGVCFLRLRKEQFHGRDARADAEYWRRLWRREAGLGD
jgi:hypothetical protein